MIPSGFGNELEKSPDDFANQPGVARERGEAVDATVAQGDFERLRELLLGSERRQLDAAQARIAAIESAQKDLPLRLPEAAIEALRNEGSSPRVADALADPVAQALAAAVERNRQSLIDTLFPIIGPLIRKAIAEALRNLVTNLNSGVESSFTLSGIRWRIEAWRAGVPYAQVVLKHRLSYRVDHVFLIERDSGIVLQHESAPDLPELDADAIAGMLTALGDFVGDSVGRGSGQTLESLRVGEHLVWVMQGPRANLACFMRGVPPAELRTLLEQRLEEIHAQIASVSSRDELKSPAIKESWRNALQPDSLVCASAALDAPTKKSPPWPLILGLLVVFGLLAWFIVSREHWNARIDELRHQLAVHPGFVLTGIDAQRWKSVTVHGLLDPDAEPLIGVLAAAQLGRAQTRIDVAGYVSSDDAIVARRATRLLAPPIGVQLTVKDDVLQLAGVAPDDWIARTRDRAQWIAGVARVELSLSPEIDQIASARSQLVALVRKLETPRIAFAADAAALAPADSIVDSLADDVRNARVLAATARVGISFAAIGLTDDPGSRAANIRIRAARAQWLIDALSARGISAIEAGAMPEGAASGDAMRAAYLHATVSELAR